MQPRSRPTAHLLRLIYGDASRSKSAVAMLAYKVLWLSGGYRWAEAHYGSDGG